MHVIMFFFMANAFQHLLITLLGGLVVGGGVIVVYFFTIIIKNNSNKIPKHFLSCKQERKSLYLHIIIISIRER